ncbi:UTP--glucose-1-phosphate uridylyltransferase [Aerococcus urinaehominis]|uniref:UTP--glucose-1-phosphate uridylyltransferase n=1 Tax=Aerococcus urinaehominis TaxID=128944 RepID=A0A109RI40_9LACT|nr:UTP--glucose-1-phosphate uridylyltransferase [Aerococcus urinaehominis]AMB99595.1 UTP--glucose-1-phosphate uridylyltransferase [Aerococcus urinaehominis]SDL86821.1 UTP--glucose-1-phosphate uridylyltransferase [Aerococcus urinaehominis]
MSGLNIKRAVIPAAGLGTRFLPSSKAMAKEIIPIVDKPTIQFIVEEALAAGIEEIMIITGRSKRSIEDHFDANYELEENLSSKQKDQLLGLVRETTLFNIQFKRQHYPAGLGDAVMQAKSFVGNEPFLLMLGDDIMVSDPVASKMMVDLATDLSSPLIAGQALANDQVSHYGIMQTHTNDQTSPIINLVEKPADDSYGNLAVIGRYILTPEIFDYLATTPVNPNSGELELTDALNRYAQDRKVYGFQYPGKWYEVGEPLGLVKASIQYALAHDQLKDDFRSYLKHEVIPNLK